MINCVCLPVALGMGTACDTLFSQSYGRNDKHIIGVHAQKAAVIFLLVSTVCACIFMHTGNILLLAGLGKEVAGLAGKYALFFIPGNFAFFMYVLLQKFIQNQNIVLPNAVIGIGKFRKFDLKIIDFLKC